jgi:DNA helicase IV
MAHPDLPAEQAYLDRAYERLEAVRAEAERQLKDAYRERGGTFQSYTERDIRVRNSLSRLEQLELGREALIFGRIDKRPGPGVTAEESFHIGRLALSDEHHEPLVVDWRAPVAEPFYRATGAQPMGLRRRRHFLAEGRRVLDLEDEVFAPYGSAEGAAVLGLSGPSVLLAALSRAHTGRMRDIVATVQAEQDEIIRAPLPGVLVVQGGPGTGKTAVALHRAAYLLYTYRWPLESQGVLVVGPNPTFLRYIDQVLPSLGETGVELTTATGLYRSGLPEAVEAPEVAHLKGDPRMATVLRRAVRQRERALLRQIEVPHGAATLVVTPEASEEIVKAARRRTGPHNARRRFVERLLWQELASQVLHRVPPRGRHGRVVVQPVDAPEQAELAVQLASELRRHPAVSEALHRMWPRLSPEELLHDLFGAIPLLESAGRGVLSKAEVDLLFRRRSTSPEEVGWTAADIALLDEALALLGPRSSGLASGGGEDGEGRVRTYGHIVADEAQDLSPMELRMLGRRSLSGSMTIVGDIAQATGAWAPMSWQDVAAHLPTERGWRESQLSVSYRAPAEVMELAASILAEALPGAVPPEPVRRTGSHPRFIEVQVGDSLASVLPSTVREELAAVASPDGGEDGNVGVLVPPALVAEARSALLASGVSLGYVGAGALDSRVSLLAVPDAKGLEFDSVVVVEPALIARGPEGGQGGMRALYVAITRCTRRLAIVFREPLPAPLARAVASATPAATDQSARRPL